MDEDLRALERSATDPVSRIRLAEALLRFGRTADAVAALLPSLEDAEVRRRAGRLTVPPVPIRDEPRVAWSTPVVASALHASPLGLVACGRRILTIAATRLDPQRATLLDAGTGAVRRTLEIGEEAVLGIYGHVLLLGGVLRERDPRGRRQSLTALDVFSGERLWNLEIDATHLGIGLRGIRLSLDGRVRELSWPYPERPPVEAAEDAELPPLPARAAQASLHEELAEMFYASNLPSATNELLARSKAGARLVLWRHTFEGPVQGVAACGSRLYVLVDGQVVCLE